MVKINISYPPYGSSQLIEVDDEKKWRCFLDKRISEEVPADTLGDEFKGYVFKITGGYDKEGFAMMQGVMLNNRTRLLLDGRTGQYTPKCKGCRKRKSVRGCIVGTDMSCINVIISKRGPTDLPKLTDKESDRPSVRGPKRAGNIRKAWGLTKKDDVRQYVVKTTKAGKDGKKDRIKSPKIQRLITPLVKRRRKYAQKAVRKQKLKSKKEAADYSKLLKQLRAEKRVSLLSKRREARSSTATGTAAKPTAKPYATKTEKPVTASKRLKVVKSTAKSAAAPKKSVAVKPTTKGVTKPKSVKPTEKKPTTPVVKAPVEKKSAPKTTTATNTAKKPETKKVAATKPSGKSSTKK